MASDSSTAVLGVVVALVVALVAAAMTLSAVRSDQQSDPSTAAGVAQAFYRAVVDGDDGAALALHEEDLAGPCATARGRDGVSRTSSMRVTLVSVDVQGDTAAVVVDVTTVEDPSPFDIDGDTDRKLLMLRRDSGTWRISEPAWPYFCTREG